MKLSAGLRIPLSCVLAVAALSPVVAPAQQEAPAAGVAVSNFQAVAEHLDLGGQVYVYRNLSGKATEAAEMIQSLVDAVPEESADEETLTRIKGIDFVELAKDLGLTGLEAAGASSIRVGDGFRNKIYLHVPGGRRGALRLLGRDAGPFEAAKIAPADADLVIEQELNLTEVYRVGRDLIDQLKMPEAERGWKQFMGRKVADFGFTLGDMLQKLDTRLLVVGRISDTEVMDLPDVPLELPKMDIFVCLDNMAWLAEKMIAELPPEAGEALEEGEGFKRLQLPPMPPDAPVIEPVLHLDLETKRVSFASSKAFLDECLSGRGGLFESDQFKAATAGLPEKGNALAYLSPDVGRHAEAILRAALESEAELEQDAINMITDRIDEVLPIMRDSYARVATNLQDGVLVVSNAPVSWKSALAALPAMVVVPMGLWNATDVGPEF